MTDIFCPSRRRMLDVLAAALILGPASKALAQGLSTLKIATIGAGNEGGALGTIFAKLGHPVMFSSRHPEQLNDLVAAAGPNARAGSVADAVAFGDIIFLVVPYSAVEQIGRDYGKALAAKPLVVDVSNPSAARDGDALAKWVDEQGGAGLATAKLLPGAHIVRVGGPTHTICAPGNSLAVARPAPPCSPTHLASASPSRAALGLETSTTRGLAASALP